MIALPRARVPAADAPQPEKLTRIVAGVLIVAALHLGREVLIPFPVLRLAGRGRLDVAAATMLAQLPQKHGIGARVEADPAASRESIETLDVTGVAMVFVSCLDLGGTPLRIRALLRRLRQRIPGVKILIGLWPHPAAEITDDAASADEGADDVFLARSASVSTPVPWQRQSRPGCASPGTKRAAALRRRMRCRRCRWPRNCAMRRV
nr:hypothetical protein [uncultured Lichenicoccus sp.]